MIIDRALSTLFLAVAVSNSFVASRHQEGHECAPGTVWNEYSQKCVHACDLPKRCDNPCTPSAIEYDQLYHEHCNDASKFVECDEFGGCFVMPCAPGSVWSQARQACDHVPGQNKLTAIIGPYPRYKGGAGSPTGSVTVEFKNKHHFNIAFDLKGLESKVEGGIAIHEGTTCDSKKKVGDHFYATDENPWLGTKYDSNRNGKDSYWFAVNDGFTFSEHIGRAVVVEAEDGTRTGCGILVIDDQDDEA